MSFSPPHYNLAVVSSNALAGKSCLCKRLIDSNVDNYRLFLVKNTSKNSSWFSWGSIKHRRLDEKREGIFHLIEHPSIETSENELIDHYLKRISTTTLRLDDKHPLELKHSSKDKLNIDGFLCIYDLSSKKIISDFVILLHSLLKTRRPLIIVTTKNDLLEHQSNLSHQFEQTIHHSFPNIPIIHTSAHEHVNIQSVLELALYACDETTRKSFHTKYIPPNYLDAYKNEQSLKHIIQSEYRALLNRHIADFRVVSWEKFYDRWQHHTSVQTFMDMFGKEQAKCLYDEYIDELKRIARQKLIDERLIPILEVLIIDQKTKLSRNWDYVRLQMQKHPRYSTMILPASIWSDDERNSLVLSEQLLDTLEARQRFEYYINNRQIEQTRRNHCRAFFDLLNRFADAGLVHYGDSYDKDCVYFLGRESYESLTAHDRLRVFALHQSYLYRLICLQFVELLFESFEIFLKTFEKMNSATNFTAMVTIDEIFQKEIIHQIKHDPRYQSLNKRETDRHRLIMCHCHFLYDCIYYPSMNISRLVKQHRRSFKRRKSSMISFASNMNVDENFCPYTRKILANNADEHEGLTKKKFEIACPMENHCADIRIVNEILARSKIKIIQKNVLLCGNDDDDVNNFLRKFSNDLSDMDIHLIPLNEFKSEIIDGCIYLSSNVQETFPDLISSKKIHLNFEAIPLVTLDVNSIFNISFDQLRALLEPLSTHDDLIRIKLNKSAHLRILICFMCGGEKNDVEIFFSQLSSRFSLMVTNQSSFTVNVLIDRSNRKVELIPVSFHSLFAVKFTDFDGFILFYDRDRKAAVNTITYLEKHLSMNLQNYLKENEIDEENRTNKHSPIYLLACGKDPTLSTIKIMFNPLESPIQSHYGTIRMFLESHFLPFLHQCLTNKYGNTCEPSHYQSEELLVGVTSYFDNTRAIHYSTNDLMSCSLEQTRPSSMNNTNRMISLNFSSRSNEHSPRHHHYHSLSTPTNQDQIFTYRSFPYLSNSTNGTESTIVPTTPVDPSIANLAVISSPSTADSQHPFFQKSTSLRFAKLIEHPTNQNNYQSSLSNGNIITRQKLAEIDEMKFRIHQHRTGAYVKVPLATPEVIEFNETLASNEQFRRTSLKNNQDDLLNSSSSIVDSSKTTIATDSSVDNSSSDERLQTSLPTAEEVITLQRKASDRKIKRIRAKQNEITGSASSSEVLKKLGSDDDDKWLQKKKRRPSFKRRKKSLIDQTQTDSGIDSRMDSNKANNTPEPSCSVVISNEDDSSVGDCTKDSKNASIEELEERPTANWIRRQLHFFAQARREKTELKTRASALTTIASVSSSPLFKPSMLSTSPFSSLENSYHRVPIRLTLSRCILSKELDIPLFIVKCVRYIEEHGLTIEGIYRVSGYKNQVELVINKLTEDPNVDLNALQIPASAVATAFKDMMRKLDEPILSLEQFDECQTLTIDQLREQNFIPLQKALLRTTDLKYRTNKFVFKHLNFVSQHAALTHMDSSNIAVLWWPNLFQPQFHDLRTAEQICQKAKPLIQAIIDNYSVIFTSEQMKDKS